MTRSAVVFRVVLFGLLLMPVSAVVLVWIGRERIAATRSGLPLLGRVQEFALTESNGKPAGLTQLRGRVWVAGFVFTHCAGTCPIITHNMKLLQQALPVRDDLKLVSISVDPARDTPAVLAEYAEKNGADRAHWWFLTGTRADVYRLTRDVFKLAVDDANGTEEEPILHSAKLVLVDRSGQIRGYYDGTDVATLKKVAKDVGLLMAQRS